VDNPNKVVLFFSNLTESNSIDVAILVTDSENISSDNVYSCDDV